VRTQTYFQHQYLLAERLTCLASSIETLELQRPIQMNEPQLISNRHLTSNIGLCSLANDCRMSTVSIRTEKPHSDGKLREWKACRWGNSGPLVPCNDRVIPATLKVEFSAVREGRKYIQHVELRVVVAMLVHHIQQRVSVVAIFATTVS